MDKRQLPVTTDKRPVRAPNFNHDRQGPPLERAQSTLPVRKNKDQASKDDRQSPRKFNSASPHSQLTISPARTRDARAPPKGRPSISSSTLVLVRSQTHTASSSKFRHPPCSPSPKTRARGQRLAFRSAWLNKFHFRPAFCATRFA